jgi:hypothetical protein
LQPDPLDPATVCGRSYTGGSEATLASGRNYDATPHGASFDPQRNMQATGHPYGSGSSYSHGGDRGSAVVQAQELDLTRSMPRLRIFTECLQAPTAGAETRVTIVGTHGAVAAETETEIVVAQDLETPMEGDPTVGIESTTVDESQIVVDTGAPLPDRGRSRSARSRSRDRADVEARDRADAAALRTYTGSLSETALTTAGHGTAASRVCGSFVQHHCAMCSLLDQLTGAEPAYSSTRHSWSTWLHEARWQHGWERGE